MKKILLLGVISLFLCAFTPSDKEIKMATTSLSKTLSAKDLSLKKEGEYFKITSGVDDLGRVYFRSLTPRVETFRYFVAVDNDDKIIQVQIVDYPSAHGAKITSRGWLDKFRGKQPAAKDFGKAVDAISGGTLSVNALIKDIKSIKNK